MRILYLNPDFPDSRDLIDEAYFSNFWLKIAYSKKVLLYAPKGQLISKYPFDVIVSTKIPTEKFDKWVGQILPNFFVGILVETMTPKGHFEIKWPLG